MLGIGPAGPVGPVGPVGPSDAAARRAMALLASVDGIGPVTIERLLAAFGSPGEVLLAARGRNAVHELRAASRGEDDLRPSLTDGAATALVDAARSPEQLDATLAAADVRIVVLEDPTYPPRLRAIELPPRVLFVRGDDMALDATHAVAVVGTRHPTPEGRRTAGRIGAALARSGALVVSGLALGIDGAAHAAVLDEHGRTVAVIGGGHDRLSPVAHDRLAAAILAAGGAVVSEHAPGVRPTAGTFPRRNRIISGLADAVVVVEAPARSGALITAAWALEQGRECFLVPGSIESPQAAGCLAWLRDFANLTRIVAGVPQLLEDLGIAGSRVTGPGRAAAKARGADVNAPPRGAAPGVVRPVSSEAAALDLPIREGRLLAALAGGATTADELAATTGLPIGAVLAGLTGLEERALVEQRFGRYDLTPLVDRPAALECSAAFDGDPVRGWTRRHDRWDRARP